MRPETRRQTSAGHSKASVRQDANYKLIKVKVWVNAHCTFESSVCLKCFESKAIWKIQKSIIKKRIIISRSQIGFVSILHYFLLFISLRR